MTTTQGSSPVPELFHQIVRTCADSVKLDRPDMADFHTATMAMKRVLRDVGYRDARVLGVSVIVWNAAGEMGSCGEFSITDEPSHSVVRVAGCILDPTAGQFRRPGIAIPDYLILPPEIAASHLPANRRWLELGAKESGVTEGQLLTFSAGSGDSEVRIAYIPTDASYRP